MTAEIFSILACVVLVDVAHAAPAKVKSSHYFSLYDDGCEHESEACETKTSLPKKKLKKEKRLASAKDYLGSIQIQSGTQNEATIDAWDHYFSDAKSCGQARVIINQKCESGD